MTHQGLRTLASLLLSLLAPRLLAPQCPPGLVSVQTFQRSTPGGRVDSRLAAVLPEGMIIDSDYRQPTSVKGSDSADLSVPPGIFLKTGGAGNWSVTDPTVIDGRVFEISMSCSSTAGLFQTGCGAHVDVCAQVRNGAALGTTGGKNGIPLGYTGWAMVIGNAKYSEPSFRLNDPGRDARALETSLTNLGWHVKKLEDLDRSQMKDALDEFSKQIKTGGVSLFYYSGHGVQANGSDFLLPIDFELNGTTPENMPDRAISLASVLNVIRTAPTRPNIVLLDSCRDNPFSSSQKGLAQPTNIPNQTIVGFAANFGSTAVESEEGTLYSPYTRAILKSIAIPGLTIEDFFKQVRASVLEYTDSSQTPREATGLMIPFAFRPGVKIKGQLLSGDDEVAVVVNGEQILSWLNDRSVEREIPLKPGQNLITIQVFNQRTFTGYPAHLAEGWNYALKLSDYTGKTLLDISDKEDQPVADGPHHGKIFAAATIAINVDIETGQPHISSADQDVWKRQK